MTNDERRRLNGHSTLSFVVSGADRDSSNVCKHARLSVAVSIKLSGAKRCSMSRYVTRRCPRPSAYGLRLIPDTEPFAACHLGRWSAHSVSPKAPVRAWRVIPSASLLALSVSSRALHFSPRSVSSRAPDHLCPITRPMSAKDLLSDSPAVARALRVFGGDPSRSFSAIDGHYG